MCTVTPCGGQFWNDLGALDPNVPEFVGHNDLTYLSSWDNTPNGLQG